MSGPRIAGDVDQLVARHIQPGMHLHFATTMSRPNALLHAVARTFRGRGDFTVSLTAIHSTAHALALSGAVRHVITCFLGDTCPTPRPNRLYRELAMGRPFTAEIWSLFSHTQRLMAAALGQPYAVTRSLLGSDLAAGKPGLYEIPDPGGDGPSVALLTPLRPDLTLLHGVCADRRGNVVLCAPLGEGAWSAYAASGGVLASVERIVADEVVDAQPDRVVVPGRLVRGLCEARFGAHPQSLRTAEIAGIPGYLDDYAFIAEVARRCAESTAEAWFEEWITLPGGHPEYLRRLGPARLAALSSAGPPPVVQAVPDHEPATESEQLIVLGARAVVGQVLAQGYDTVLAGIGCSHLAAWLARLLLHRRGHEVKLVAEQGFYGVDPVPGDVFLFSQRHAARSEQLTGTAEILGGMVAANPRCLGVLSTAEVDEQGGLNTSRLPDGSWITGSGGANDIASTADCVVVAPASPRRYVHRVAHLTSPGARVREVVSQHGRFRRTHPGGPFELATYLPASGGPAELVAEHTRWSVATARAQPEPPVSADELALLRHLDPEGVYR